MPAPLPGSSLSDNLGNPASGRFVIFDPLSGPKGSPLDKDPAGKASTGALQTGIGFSAQDIFNALPSSPVAIFNAGFNDNDIPGEVPTYAAPPPNGVVASSAINSTRMYIGGGRCDPPSNGFAAPDPYTAGVAICGAGNGGARDGGAGPAYTGFPLKTVTATGAVANGAVIETGWVNRSGKSLTTGQSSFGSSTAVLAAAS